MLSKRKLLNAANLYLILDRNVNTYDQLFEIATQAVKTGVDVIQLRDKKGTAKEILKFSKRVLRVTKERIPYIINDRVDLAMISGASGVHLGQEDIPLLTARTMMGKKAIIGVSCQTFAHARKAQEEGADYIGFGSVFKTLTKPERQPLDLKLLEEIYRNIKIPVFAIGGIGLKNVVHLKESGVNRIAVCRAICKASDREKTIGRFKAHFHV